MKFITTKIHAFMDYTLGLLLIASPWLFGFYNDNIESFIPIIFGIALIIYSLFTNYEWSISKTMTLEVHFFIDVVSGIFLAISPWVLGFSGDVYLPHLIFGIIEICAGLFTKNTPYLQGRTEFKGQV